MSNVKFFEKLKKTYRYYKSLCKNSKLPQKAEVKIRPDAIAFLTCPYPVFENKRIKEKTNVK